MNTIELTTTEFRQNQKKFLDMASKGVSILICRGKELFVLNRVTNERRLDADTLRQIETSRKEFEQGHTVGVSSREELNELLNTL